jgi:hypothetical protein
MHRFAFVAAALIVTAACEPLGPLPGGELQGEVTPPPRTWTEADAAETVQLETRPGDPYSINIWGVGIGPDYYIASGSGGDASWVEHITADPHVRLRIGRDIHRLVATRVTDPDELKRVRDHYATKYHRTEEQMAEADGAWVYRLDPR